MKRTVTLIIHGSRKLSDKTIETISLLQNEPTLTVREKITQGPGNASKMARSAMIDSDFVIAVGGDGTCNEVVNGLMLEQYPKSIFGVIPNGTGNDFVRNFPPFNSRSFVSAIVDNVHHSLDLGKVSFDTGSRYFLNVSDIGFGAQVIQTMNKQRNNGLGGKLSYHLAIVRSFFSYRKPYLTVESENIEFSGKSLMIVFSNGTSFGSGLQIYPEAKIDNGKLGLAIIGDVSLIQYAKNLGRLRRGEKIIHPEVRYSEFEKLHVSSANKNLFVETDGEIAGRPSITVEVVPSALQIVV